MQILIGNTACRRVAKVLLLTVGILLLMSQLATAQGVTECDRIAAVPGDPEAVAPGVETWSFEFTRAISACEDAIKRNPKIERFQFQLAIMKLYQNRKLEASIASELDALEELGAKGYQHAYFMLGRIYGDKFFKIENYLVAVRQYEKAIALGSGPAKLALGWIYLSSKHSSSFSDEDQGKAKRWLQEAAASGDKDGQLAFGKWISKSNSEHAFKLFRKSAKSGHPAAMLMLFWEYSDEKSAHFDEIDARSWLEQSAEAGYPPAMISLAYEYQYGDLYPADATKALEWMAKFAANLMVTESEKTMAKLKISLRKTFTREIEIYRQEQKKDDEKKE
jgi:hypothetical protein